MSDTMNHRGYTARVEFDPRDNLFWGKVLGLPGSVSITFEGDTVADLIKDFHNAVDFYIEECAKTGRKPIKPASGKLMLRVPPEVHGSALIAAQSAGKSLNQWATEILREAAHA